MKKELTVRQIIQAVVDRRMWPEDAIDHIDAMIARIIDEYCPPMGPTEYKYFTDIIRQGYREYGYSLKGTAGDLKEILQNAIEQCGFPVFEEIKSTPENRRKIEDWLAMNRSHYLG